MSRIHEVLGRYEACASILEYGVGIFAVGDPNGAQLDAAVRRSAFQSDESGSDVWGDLLHAACALRWRRMSQPQPNELNPAVAEAAASTVRQAQLLRGAVANEALLDDLVAAAELVRTMDSPVGAELLRSIQEVGPAKCVVVAASHPSRTGLLAWLEIHGVQVVTPGELGSVGAEIEQAYFVGPPRFFPSAMVTAPATEEVTFVLPAWFPDKTIPRSRFAEHADGGIAVKAQVFMVGEMSEPDGEAGVIEPIDERQYFPQPDWGGRLSAEREPASDEVEAWKVLLGRGLAIWLDDGERIRTLDPRQPEGERVHYTSVDAVVPGIYLVLSEGVTERGVMHAAAMHLLGGRAAGIAATQAEWKQALEERLNAKGTRMAVAELRAIGVRSAGRVRAWAEPTLISPKHEQDLVFLLEWLGLPIQPSYSNARLLRRALYQASSDLREELERAVGVADLTALERDGHMRLDLERQGFRGMVVARVLARSPYTEIVLRPRTRVPFEEGDTQWLE